MISPSVWLHKILFSGLLFLLVGLLSTTLSGKGLPEAHMNTDTIPRISLPFGNPELVRMKFPRYWEADSINYGQLRTDQGVTPSDLSTEYSVFIQQRSWPLTLTGSKDRLQENDALLADYYFDEAAASSTDSCIGRLPDMGPYQCYMFKGFTQHLQYGQYLNLLFFDPQKDESHIATIYFEYGGDQCVNLRYFYIDARRIILYDGSCYDDGCLLNRIRTLIVRRNGKIRIKNH